MYISFLSLKSFKQSFSIRRDLPKLSIDGNSSISLFCTNNSLKKCLFHIGIPDDLEWLIFSSVLLLISGISDLIFAKSSLFPPTLGDCNVSIEGVGENEEDWSAVESDVGLAVGANDCVVVVGANDCVVDVGANGEVGWTVVWANGWAVGVNGLVVWVVGANDWVDCVVVGANDWVVGVNDWIGCDVVDGNDDWVVACAIVWDANCCVTVGTIDCATVDCNVFVANEFWLLIEVWVTDWDWGVAGDIDAKGFGLKGLLLLGAWILAELSML